jgi:hypothetical protein
MRTAQAALAFIHERRFVLATGRGSLPTLAEAITGRALAGSWMADREVFRIHAMLKAVTKARSVVAVPLALGKETLLDRSLAPAVVRLAADPARRQLAISRLPLAPRRLLAQVEAEGEVRMDRVSVPTVQGRKARLRLERELLVVSTDLHTERGYHTAVVIPWAASTVARRFARPARRVSSDEAQDLLIRAAIRSAVLAPEREARRWFVFGADRFDRLIARGELQRLVSGRMTWLATAPVRG